MKLTTISAAILGLSLSTSFGGDCGSYTTVSCSVHGGRSEAESKAALLNRLAIAPMQCQCAANVPIIRNAAAVAATVKMLGKIGYESGSGGLGCREQEEIDRIILNSGMPLGPETLIVVLGYADRAGCPDVSFQLTGKRATSVKTHIDQLSCRYCLGIQTATVAMGEEIEFCDRDFGHNRISEIWLLNFPRPLQQAVNGEFPAFMAAPSQPPGTDHQAPPQFQPQAPQQFLPQAPPQFQPQAPQQFQPQAPQQFLPQGPQQFQPHAPQQFQPQRPQQFLPEGLQQFQPQAPQQFQPQGPQQFLPEAPQQFLPPQQQFLSQVPQQFLPQMPQQFQPQAPSN